MSLNAIIMAGGEGSRLRPLTCDTPKPMVPILGKPVMSYALQLLRLHGLTEVGVTLQYLPERISRAFGSGAKDGVNIHYSREHEPLGTAGGVLQAAKGRHTPGGTFVVLSGDGLTDCNLTEAIQFHKEKGALATLVLTRVLDPLAYGVVIVDEDGRVKRFVEKPGWGEVYSDTINTGIYLLEPEVLSYIWPDKPCDFGKDLFPALVKEGKGVYAFVTDSYWCDIGDQAAYVHAQADFLLGKVNLDAGPFIAETAQVHETARIDGPCYLGPGARVSAHARLSDCAVIGMNTAVGTHAQIARSIIWEDAVIQHNAQIRGAVVGRGAQVGAGATILEDSALGDGAVLGARATLEAAAKVWPGKRIDPCMRVTENLVWGGAARPALAGGKVDARDPASVCILSAAWAEAAKAVVIAASHEPVPQAEALYAASIGALSAQNVRVIAIGAAYPPILRRVQRLMDVHAGMYVSGNELMLTVQDGGIPERAIQRKVEALFVRQDFDRPFAKGVQRPEWIVDGSALYVGSLASAIPYDTFESVKPHVVVIAQNQALAALASRVLQAVGLPGRAVFGDSHVDLWETGFLLSETGETVAAFDSQGIPDPTAQMLLAYAAMEPTEEWIIRIDAPAALEDMALASGAAVRRVSSAREAWAGALLKADKRQFDLHFDGLYRMLRIAVLLAERRTTLRGLLSALPPVYRHEERLPCALPDRGRLIRTIAENEAKAELDGGLHISRNNGWLSVDPDERAPEMLVIGEGATMEAAKELCGELMERLRGLMPEQKDEG